MARRRRAARSRGDARAPDDERPRHRRDDASFNNRRGRSSRSRSPSREHRRRDDRDSRRDNRNYHSQPRERGHRDDTHDARNRQTRSPSPERRRGGASHTESHHHEHNDGRSESRRSQCDEGADEPDYSQPMPGEAALRRVQEDLATWERMDKKLDDILHTRSTVYCSGPGSVGALIMEAALSRAIRLGLIPPGHTVFFQTFSD